MSFFPQLKRPGSKQWGCALALVILGVTLEATESKAQSGRRAAKPSSPATATPPASATPGESSNADKVKAPTPGELSTKVQLLVARQPTSRHLQSEDQIFASFVKH